MHRVSRLAARVYAAVASIIFFHQPRSQILNERFRYIDILVSVCSGSPVLGEEYDGCLGDTLDAADDVDSSNAPVNEEPHALQCLDLDKLGYRCRQIW